MQTALQTIQTAHLAHVGETIGKLEELDGLIRALLGENFNPTLPATETDAAIILDWLSSGTKADCPNTRREYLRDICGPHTGFLTFVNRKSLGQVSRQDMHYFKTAIGEVVVPVTSRRPSHQLSIGTQRRMLSAVKGLLSHANGLGLIPFNAGKGVTLPSAPSSKRDKALQHADSLRMLITAQTRAAATETEKRQLTRRRDFLLNKLCYVTGGRISEILNLTWANVYATDKGGECRILGKGSKERIVNIPAEVFEALQAERAARQAGDADFVFISQKGGRLSHAQAWRIITGMGKAAGIQKRVTPHTWRHSVATQLLDKGAPLHQVSEFLGHADPKTTIKHYYSSSTGLRVEEFIEL